MGLLSKSNFLHRFVLALLAAVVAVCCASACAASGDAASTASNADPVSQEASAHDQSEGETNSKAEESAAQVEKNSSEQPVDPHALAAGTVLTNKQIERAGGTDAFFWAEPVPADVFARMEGKSYGADCTVPLEDLRYVKVLHVTAENERTVGELVVNAVVADEVVDIFRQLYDAGYPIRKMHLVDDYDASDEASFTDDNTSAFNFRLIAGTSQISNHALGLAIDINPFENPYISASGAVIPEATERYADRTLDEPYVLHEGDLCYELFTSHGWGWGGAWSSPIDYQHFEKPGAY